MKKLTLALFAVPAVLLLVVLFHVAAVHAADANAVTLKGMLGCGKCSVHEAKACQNVLKVKTSAKKEDTYVLKDNEVSRANHEKVCGPASPATVTGTVEVKGKKKILTASAIVFD